MTVKNSPLWVLLIQVGTSYGAYIFAKFASKVKIQEFSFALPLCAVVPMTVTLLLTGTLFFFFDILKSISYLDNKLIFYSLWSQIQRQMCIPWHRLRLFIFWMSIYWRLFWVFVARTGLVMDFLVFVSNLDNFSYLVSKIS